MRAFRAHLFVSLVSRYFLITITSNVVAFVVFFCLIGSLNGGGFATMPAYLADLFGTKVCAQTRSVCERHICLHVTLNMLFVSAVSLSVLLPCRRTWLPFWAVSSRRGALPAWSGR